MTTRKTTRERRQEIVAAAIEIMGQRGLRAFTAANLARRVGIKDGTIFRHFKDMNEIAGAALERLQALMEQEQPAVDDPLERLEAFVSSRLRSAAAQPGILSLIFSDQLAHALGAEGPRRVAALRNKGREIIRSWLGEAAEAGRLRAELDIDSAVVVVTGAVMGFLFAAKDGAITGSHEQAARRVWSTLAQLLVGQTR